MCVLTIFSLSFVMCIPQSIIEINMTFMISIRINIIITTIIILLLFTVVRSTRYVRTTLMSTPQLNSSKYN